MSILCTSPGYVHTLAYLCYRDTFIRYEDEIGAEDMNDMFDESRLIRTEISTLFGLMVQKPIDYTLPSSQVTQAYVEETEALLKEIHEEMMRPVFSNRDWMHADVSANPFDRGEVMREIIFYSGESAFQFQYCDLSERKYAQDVAWLEQNKGFNMQDAKRVYSAVRKIQNEKLMGVLRSFAAIHPDDWTVLPGFSFSAKEVAQLAGVDKRSADNVLRAFSIAENETNQGFQNLNDFNVANSTPLLRLGNEEFILFTYFSFAEALYETPFYWMGKDPRYVATAMAHRGVTEEFSCSNT